MENFLSINGMLRKWMKEKKTTTEDETEDGETTSIWMPFHTSHKHGFYMPVMKLFSDEFAC